MNASLRALLAGIIDYAGLFPPAKLPLDQAIRNYAKYRAGDDAWLLGRFICPAARLPELSPFVTELFATGAPLAVSALGRGGNTQTEFVAGLELDLHEITAFRERHGGRVTVDVLETRQPLSGEDSKQIEAVTRTVREVDRTGGLTLFVEPPPDSAWRANTEFLCVVLRSMNPSRGAQPVGLKLRCGGLEANAFPSASNIALALAGAVRLKATAGLHHPFRHPDRAIGATMHGFINVFGAGVLAYVHRLKPEVIEAMILDDSPTNFVFTDDEFRWRDLRATTEQIQAARREAVLSFGSCSFDEPRDDLRALGWM